MTRKLVRIVGMSPGAIAQETMNHWRTYFPKVWAKADYPEIRMAAYRLAEKTRKEMDKIKKTVPGMSDQEAWIETMELYCITPYPPEIPIISKEHKAIREEIKQMSDEEKRENLIPSWR